MPPDDEENTRRIAREEAESLLEQKLRTLRINLAESSLNDPAHNLVFLLESAGYKRDELKEISGKSEGMSYIFAESVELSVSDESQVPILKAKQTQCTLDVNVNANYSMHVAIVNGTSVNIHEVRAQKEITINVNEAILPDKLKEFNISNILAKEGYTSFKGNEYIDLPSKTRMFVRNYGIFFVGKYNLVEGQKIYASGKLKVNGDFLIYIDKDLKLIKVPAEIDVDANYKVSLSEVKDVESGGNPKYTKLPVKVPLDVDKAVSVTQDYKQKSNNMYRDWVVEQVTNTTAMQVRSQLGLSLGEMKHTDQEAIAYLANTARENTLDRPG